MNFLYQKAFWGIKSETFLDSLKSILYLFAQQPPTQDMYFVQPPPPEIT